MLDREPFLRAIYAAPADDLPRLVFADYLDEQGEPAWAELIRLQCAADPTPAHAARIAQLVAVVFAGYGECVPMPADFDRGFRADPTITVPADLLADPDAFRVEACSRFPEWYGATRLKVTGGLIVTRTPMVTILTGPVTEHVTELDLSGREESVSRPENFAETDAANPDLDIFWGSSSYEFKPVISTRMVEQFVELRESRRLTALDLRNNNLDNDAARALARSPHLLRLRRLQLFDGNRFRGKVWQLVHERFGPDVLDPATSS